MGAGVDLDGVRGKIFQADAEARTFELLKETVFDPKTDEGRSRHTVHWIPETRFVRVDRQNSFEGLNGERLAHIRPLKKETAESEKDGEKTFVTLNVTVFADSEDGTGWSRNEDDVLAPFTPDPTSHKHRGGAVTIDGTSVPVRLRGPRAQVDVRTVVAATAVGSGFWETRIHGARDEEGRFVASRMDLYPRVDPRTVDDPDLPRVLVVGDSISMNYHRAAKVALDGVANYHRIDGNGGPSDHGVVCMALWLGDYEQEGLHWDVIQFNHGLHDLKQFYDEETGTYGAHQVELDDYKANLEKEIQIMRKTGAVLMWCATTPIPNSYFGRWRQGLMGRREGEAMVYNRAALEVLENHPDILVNDLHKVIREDDSGVFDNWRKGKDVHFWGRNEQEGVGKAVAAAIQRALVKIGE